MPGNDAAKARVICPFFRRFSAGGMLIVCEGVQPKIETCTLFKCYADRQKWLDAYCNQYDYDRCPIAAAVNKKIEEA